MGMPNKISPEIWEEIEIVYTTTLRPVLWMATTFNVSHFAIRYRAEQRNWQRPTGAVDRSRLAVSDVKRHTEERGAAALKARPGAFAIPAIPGSSPRPFHMVRNQGPRRECVAILDDRPGAMDTALTCAEPTADDACPYCPGHLKRFTPTPSAPLTPRSLRKYIG